jgi:hypothetical protein
MNSPTQELPSTPSLFTTPSHPQLSYEEPVLFLRGDLARLEAPLSDAFEQFRRDYDRMPEDCWLRGDYVFRWRRFSLFSIDTQTKSLHRLARRAFYQALDVNSYAGGMARDFEPLEDETADNPFLHQLIRDVHDVLPRARVAVSRHWEIGVHLVRVIARPGKPGHPAPEGMHRDGHAFTSITLMKRVDVDGGVSRFARKDGSIFCERTMSEPLETVVFDDDRGVHDVTSIAVRENAPIGVRDICGFSLNPM